MSSRTAMLIVAGVAIASSVRGLFNDFVYDDIPIIRDNVRVHDLLHLRDLFVHPYWPPPFVEQLYRPLTLVALAVEYAGGGGNPILFRLVSYVLYAALSVMVYRLARRILEPRLALAMAALFAAHPVHVEAVALGVNQAELMVALVAVAMTTRYIDRQRDGSLNARDWTILAALYGLATLVKESAFILPLLLLAAELTVLRRGAQPMRRPNAIGGLVLLVVVAVASVGLRVVLSDGSPFAVVPAPDLRGLDVLGRAGVMLHVAPQWFRLLVWPQHLQADFAPGEILSDGAIGAALGAMLLCGFMIALLFTLVRAPAVAFGLLWLIVTLLPVSNLVPTGVVLAERTLLLPSAGFLIAVGAVAERICAMAQSRQRQIVVALSWSCALLVFLGVLRSMGRHAVWNTQHLVVRHVSLDIGRSPASGGLDAARHQRLF